MNAHRDTQRTSRLREEALESAVADGAEALAKAERRAEAEREASAKTTESFRAAQHQLQQEVMAREDAENRNRSLQAEASKYRALEEQLARSQQGLSYEQERCTKLETTIQAQEQALKALREELQVWTQREKNRKEARKP